MKKLIALIVAIVCFVACGEIPEGDNIATSKVELLTSLGDEEEEKKDSVVKQEEKTNVNVEASARINTAQKILLIARGSEPGWYAEFSANHLRMLHNNGQDSLHLDHDFNKITDANFETEVAVEFPEGFKVFKVTIIKKDCIEAGSGEKRDRSILIKLGKEVFKGCALVK